MINQISFYRRARGITQQKLAKLLNVSQATIHNWEQDFSEPNPAQQDQLASFLGAHLEIIFSPYTPEV